MVNRLPGKSLLALLALSACIPLAQAADAPTLNTGSTAWMVTAAVLVLFMCLPGLALFYGGLVRAKNMLSLFTQCFGIAGLVGCCGWFMATAWWSIPPTWLRARLASIALSAA